MEKTPTWVSWQRHCKATDSIKIVSPTNTTITSDQYQGQGLNTRKGITCDDIESNTSDDSSNDIVVESIDATNKYTANNIWDNRGGRHSENTGANNGDDTDDNTSNDIGNDSGNATGGGTSGGSSDDTDNKNLDDISKTAIAAAIIKQTITLKSLL